MYETQREVDAVFRTLPEFTLREKLGEGSFGLTFLVDDHVDGNRKVVRLPGHEATSQAVGRNLALLREIGSRDHPHLVPLHRVGRTTIDGQGSLEERFYLVTAFAGTSLRSRLGSLRKDVDEQGRPYWRGGGGRLPHEQVLRIGIDLCSGLSAIHGDEVKGEALFHGNIKPSNIFPGEDGSARLGDWGFAHTVRWNLDLLFSARSLPYFDPACLKATVDRANDFYALGVVLYEMLTGELPFGFPDPDASREPTPLEKLVADLPEGFEGILARAWRTDPSDFYRDAREMLSELRRVLAATEPLPARYAPLGKLPCGRQLCRDQETQQRVAVRIVATEATVRDISADCRQIEMLEHDALVPPLRHARHEQFAVIVSPAAKQPDFASHFPPERLLSIEGLAELSNAVAELTDLLSLLHRHDLWHGLLSPYNISKRRDGGWQLEEAGCGALLRSRTDRGDSSLEYLTALVPFMSPQLIQGRGNPGPRDDIYALGAILYQLIAGQPPLDQEQRHRLLLGGQVAERSINVRQFNESVPVKLEGVIARSLRMNPADRFQDVDELARILRSLSWPGDVVSVLIADSLDAFRPGDGPSGLVKACKLIEKALHLAPGNVEAHFARGVLYLRNGSYKFAAEEFDKAARVAPTKETFDLLGMSYAECEDRLEDAAVAYREALTIGQDPSIAERLAHVLWRQEHRQDAMAALQQAIDGEEEDDLRERRALILDEWKEAVRTSGENNESSMDEEAS